MAVGCGGKCAKIILIVFNLIFWLSGVAILAIGIWMRVDTSLNRYLDVLDKIDDTNFIYLVSYVMMGAGCFVLLVGFLGCCGALKESKCMLGFYIFFLMIVLIVELAAGILAIVFKNKIIDEVQDKWGEVIEKEYQLPEGDNEPNAFTLGMDFLQVKFECCGVTDGREAAIAVYHNTSYITDENEGGREIQLPHSCCKLDPTKAAGVESISEVDDFVSGVNDDQPQQFQSDSYIDLNVCRDAVDANSEEYINTDGCYESLKDFIESKALILIAVGIAIACIQFFGIVCAFCLCRNTGKEV